MKTLMISVLAALATTASAQTLRAPIGPQKPVRAMPTPPPITVRPEVQGVVPRAFRGGNPLQMLNPGAPARYGTGEQSLAYNPFTGRYDQIKLFEIVF
ncbi:MAG: hypothetical protein DME60_10040 [Verrucomicrobia bacterium]|nr:MAG: hypothetical protein DME60_10040 [Verrucomicrobiota bacterium]